MPITRSSCSRTSTSVKPRTTARTGKRTGESAIPSGSWRTTRTGGEGNYPVAYWQPEWHDVWLGDDGLIEPDRRRPIRRRVPRLGRGLQRRQRGDGRRTGRGRPGATRWSIRSGRWPRPPGAGNPDFLVIGQNAAELAAGNAEYARSGDRRRCPGAGLVRRCGRRTTLPATARFHPPTISSTPRPTRRPLRRGSACGGCLRVAGVQHARQHEEYLVSLDAIRATGLPVLTVDYASDPDNVKSTLESVERTRIRAVRRHPAARRVHPTEVSSARYIVKSPEEPCSAPSLCCSHP